MTGKANTKLIGAFVLGSVVLIAVVFVVFGSGDYFRELEYYVMYFDGDVNGLRKGSPIKWLGIPMGMVKEITGLVDDSGNFIVEVITEVDRYAISTFEPGQSRFDKIDQAEMVDFYVKKGLKAQLATVSMVTGQLYIKIDYFPDIETRLYGIHPDLSDVELPVAPRSGEQLRAKLEGIIQKIVDLPLVEMAQTLQSSLDNLDSMLSSPEWRNAVVAMSSTLKETERLMVDVRNDIRPMTSNLSDAAVQARATLAKTEQLMAGLERAADNDRYDVKIAIKELTEATRAMRVLMDHLQRDPGSIVWGKD